MSVTDLRNKYADLESKYEDNVKSLEIKRMEREAQNDKMDGTRS